MSDTFLVLLVSAKNVRATDEIRIVWQRQHESQCITNWNKCLAWSVWQNRYRHSKISI